MKAVRRAEIESARNNERHPRNAPGPFFVERAACIACMAPLHEAPDLIAYEEGGPDEGCYFARQPATPEEWERAVAAVEISCCEAVRYGGTDEAVVARLIGGPGGRAV